MIAAHLEHMRRRNLAPATIDARRRKLAAFDSDVGLATATAESVELFLDRRDLSPKGRYDWLSHLSCFYRWAIDYDELAGGDPTARVVRPRLRRRLPRPISTSDLHVALEMASPTMRAWLSLAAFAGLRCVEISRLEVDDLLWHEHEPMLRIHGKGDVERIVPMHAELERVLRATVLPKRGRLFRRPRGGGYPAAQVSREVSLYLESLGIAATAHQLRHWFGTNIYRVSRDLRVTQELMGHASPTTTAIYAAWSKEEAHRAVGALELDSPAEQSSLLSEW